MKFLKAILKYDDKIEEFPPNKMTFYDELYVDFKIIDTGNFKRFTLAIHPKKSVTIHDLELQFETAYIKSDGTKIFCNGYQSWSESREYSLDEKMPRLKKWFTGNLKYQGDDLINSIPRSKNHYHSWTYTYLRNSNVISFIGSLKEDTAFTYFIHDTQSHRLLAKKDLEGLQLEHSFPVLDMIVMKGEEKSVFQRWFSEMNLPALTAKPSFGWTSWYHHFTNISEEIILKNLKSIQDLYEVNEDLETKVDYFQIDDGYQNKVGDWLNIKSSFPNGLASISQKIKQANYKPGIWLAPFICEIDSDIFKNKKHWIVKNKNGQPLPIGNNKLWSGNFFALDFYQKEVQEYLASVIYTFINKWGFEMIKMDFLYAVCIQPPKNKTRGQVMHDAMTFLRHQVGQKTILGSGVPLGSAFGKVDFCRIGPDVHMSWEDKKRRFLGHRERTSTLLSLRSTLGRWQLNGHGFYNDPDVFILRKNNNNLTSTQQYTLLIINALLGNLIFTSDDFSSYSDEQIWEYDYVKYLQTSEIKSVKSFNKNHYIIEFKNQGIDFATLCNLDKKRSSIPFGKTSVELEPFETMIFAKWKSV